MLEQFGIFAIVAAVVVGFLVLGAVGYILARLYYRKAGPDEALIIYGRRSRAKGFRIVRGGGTFVWPAWESAQRLSLKMMTLDLDLENVYSAKGIPINVQAVAQVKVKGHDESIRRAAEGFLGTRIDDVSSTIKETVSGHLRGIIGTLTIEELYRDQRRFQEAVRKEAEVDLDGMGFEFKSFVFRKIHDDQGYLDALGQPKIQSALRDARIATANADRDAAIEEEQARQVKEQKRIGVDTEIADAGKDLSLKHASIKQEVDVAQAVAVKSGEMETKIQDIEIAKREVDRAKLELNATVREKADAAKYEAERLADAEKYRIEKKASAERLRREQAALATKAEGLAHAEAESAKRRDIGLAEADAVRAKGEAEAEARRLLAEALKLYNEAGLSIEALKALPEIAAAVAEPLSRAGETTIISYGSGENGKSSGTGASMLSQDVVSVLSQLTPLLEQLSGVDLKSLLQDITKMPGAINKKLSHGEGGSEDVN